MDSGGALRVGPRSAGADPGPVCYGRGTELTVSDANLLLGRLTPAYFLGGRMTLDVERARRAMRELASQLGMEEMELAEGIIRVANSNMERAIRVVSVQRGFDPREFALLAFGGAGGMHACEIAATLEIATVIVPRHAGVLSALGMLLADVTKDYSRPSFAATTRRRSTKLGAVRALAPSSGVGSGGGRVRGGRDAARSCRSMFVTSASRTRSPFRSRPLIARSSIAACTAVWLCESAPRRRDRQHSSEGDGCDAKAELPRSSDRTPQRRGPHARRRRPLRWPRAAERVLPLGGTGAGRRCRRSGGHRWRPGYDSGAAWLQFSHRRVRKPRGRPRRRAVKCGAPRVPRRRSRDGPRHRPIEFEVFKNLFVSVAEEMGVTLCRTGFSPNIKERLDYSCAVYDRHGRTIAQGDHMPVHLGAMPLSVRAAIEHGPDRARRHGRAQRSVPRRDAPAGHHAGLAGVHLRRGRRSEPAFYVANRAHHSDVGGMTPGSMPLAREVFQEGLIIPPVKLARRGEIVPDVMALILANVRTPEEREGDITAQIAANRVGEARLREIVAKYGLKRVELSSRRRCRTTASAFCGRRSRGFPTASTRSKIGSTATASAVGPSSRFGSTLRVVGRFGRGGLFWQRSADHRRRQREFRHDPFGDALRLSLPRRRRRALQRRHSPARNGGRTTWHDRERHAAGSRGRRERRDITAHHRRHPRRPRARASGPHPGSESGNDEQRDAWRRRTRAPGRPFAYYETIGGGMGARRGSTGISGVHTHMSNTRNTPVEAIEHYLPVRIVRYGLRPSSGGAGRYRGGDGIVREYEMLATPAVTVISERRRTPPYGAQGGAPDPRPQHRRFDREWKRWSTARCGSTSSRATGFASNRPAVEALDCQRRRMSTLTATATLRPLRLVAWRIAGGAARARRRVARLDARRVRRHAVRARARVADARSRHGEGHRRTARLASRWSRPRPAAWSSASSPTGSAGRAR